MLEYTRLWRNFWTSKGSVLETLFVYESEKHGKYIAWSRQSGLARDTKIGILIWKVAIAICNLLVRTYLRLRSASVVSVSFINLSVTRQRSSFAYQVHVERTRRLRKEDRVSGYVKKIPYVFRTRSFHRCLYRSQTRVFDLIRFLSLSLSNYEYGIHWHEYTHPLWKYDRRNEILRTHFSFLLDTSTFWSATLSKFLIGNSRDHLQTRIEEESWEKRKVVQFESKVSVNDDLRRRCWWVFKG